MEIEMKPDRPTVVLFHMNGCPSCKALMPEWTAASKIITANGTAHIQEVERNSNSGLTKLNEIRSWPTIIKFTPDGHRVVYDGDRSTADLVKFAADQHHTETPKLPKGHVLVLFMYWDICHHCKAMRPAWEEAKKNLLKHKNITCKEHEADEEPGMMEKYGVEGYPTLLAITAAGEEPLRYTGDRSSESIQKFAIEASLSQ